METRIRVITTELIGTFCLVVLTGGAVCAAHLPPDVGGPPINHLWAIALANGCALAVLLTLSTSISEGCLNPAVTLVLWVCRRLEGWQTVSLIIAQLAGAMLAGLALRVVFPEQALFASRLGTPHLGTQLLGEGDVVTWRGIFVGVGVEALATFVLTVVIFFTLLDRRAGRVGGLYAGLALAALTIFGYSLTGCAANPARWFGPAVWQLSVQPLKTGAPFADNMVYWTGPIVGALLAGLLYTTILNPAAKSREAG